MGKNKMKTGWHYKEQDLPIGTEDKEALLTILKNFIDNIENTIEYQFNMYTETEEVQESSSKWKEFRPVGGSIHLSVSARLDKPVAKAEDAKNADTKKETHNIAPRAFTIFNGTKIVFAGEWELDNLKRNGYFSVDYIPATAKEYLQTLDDFFRKSIKEKITILLCATGKQYLSQVYLINRCFTDHLGWLSVKYGFAVSGDIVEL